MSDEVLKPWTVRGARSLIKDRWLDLVAEDCVTPRGAELNPFYIFNYPDFVHAAAITSDGEVVLVRQYRHGARHVSLELPGGLVDPDEDAVTAAVRELREETGYAGDSATLVHSGWANPVHYRNRLHLVLITGARLAGEAAPEPTEAFEVLTLPWPDLAARVRNGEVSHPTQLSSFLHLNLLAGGTFSPLPAGGEGLAP